LQMPSFVYYKAQGVATGPLREVEATALYKAGFFRPEHTFRVVNTDIWDKFHPIEYLLKHNQQDPFKEPVDQVKKKDKKETEVKLLRSSVILANELRIQEFNAVMKREGNFTLRRCSIPEDKCFDVHTEITSHIPIAVRVMYGNEWDVGRSWELSGYGRKAGDWLTAGSFIFVAPVLSEDSTNREDLVCKFPLTTMGNKIIDIYTFP
ncbi:hypothetical protein PFISCL1PPCAC_23040, partial [Pristionchus fissidentatus]